MYSIPLNHQTSLSISLLRHNIFILYKHQYFSKHYLTRFLVYCARVSSGQAPSNGIARLISFISSVFPYIAKLISKGVVPIQIPVSNTTVFSTLSSVLHVSDINFDQSYRCKIWSQYFNLHLFYYCQLSLGYAAGTISKSSGLKVTISYSLLMLHGLGGLALALLCAFSAFGPRFKLHPLPQTYCSHNRGKRKSQQNHIKSFAWKWCRSLSLRSHWPSRSHGLRLITIGRQVCTLGSPPFYHHIIYLK